jgi:hypothetical protein
LKRILELQLLFNVDLTGDQQHGFKKTKSTATADLLLQSIITKHLDANEIVGMASLDLSAAFDVVNIDLNIERIKILGLPEMWLTMSKCGSGIDPSTFQLTETIPCKGVLATGTVQGSILGPILYAMYVTPLFDLHSLTNYADDKFIIRWNSHRPGLIAELEGSLEAITNWLRGSGLTVNRSKMELCLFYRLDQPKISINFFNTQIKFKGSINVLRVIFDSKLQWT